MKWSVILVLWLVLAPMLVVSQKDVALRKRKSIKQRLRNGGKVEEVRSHDSDLCVPWCVFLHTLMEV